MTLLNFNSRDPKRTGEKKTLSIILGIGALVGVIALGSTLAASINLNSNNPVEFGQGVTQTTACDSEILVTPYSKFVNGDPGAFMFSGIRLSQVDTTDQSGPSEGCAGKSFLIKLYQENGEPIDVSYTISVSESGTFSSNDGEGTTSGENGTDSSVNLVFPPQEVLASDVYRITIESNDSVDGTPAGYEVGDTGPGGGIIFYYSEEGFNCGSLFSATGSPTGGKCNYLEAAPTMGTNAWTDAEFVWSGNTEDFINSTSDAIGSGYFNSIQMIEQSPSGDTPDRAATISRAYRGPNDKRDWYLPSEKELYELWLQRTMVGVAGGTWWSSTETGNNRAVILFSWDGFLPSGTKSVTSYVRPIRAF